MEIDGVLHGIAVLVAKKLIKIFLGKLKINFDSAFIVQSIRTCSEARESTKSIIFSPLCQSIIYCQPYSSNDIMILAERG